ARQPVPQPEGRSVARGRPQREDERGGRDARDQRPGLPQVGAPPEREHRETAQQRHRDGDRQDQRVVGGQPAHGLDAHPPAPTSTAAAPSARLIGHSGASPNTSDSRTSAQVAAAMAGGVRSAVTGRAGARLTVAVPAAAVPPVTGSVTGSVDADSVDAGSAGSGSAGSVVAGSGSAGRRNQPASMTRPT